jgi:hypothetical protein
MHGGFEGEIGAGGWMCAMFLISMSSQYIDRVFLYLTQKNHLDGFRLSHRGTLAVAYPRVPTVGRKYEMCVRGEYVAILDPLDLVRIYKFL